MELRTAWQILAIDNLLGIEKTTAMKTGIAIALLLSTATGCFEKENSFSVGQCVHAVDGGTSFQLTAVTPQLVGKKIVNKVVGAEAVELPTGRIYSQVPCPQ